MLSNRSELLWYYLFHSVHSEGTNGYITLVIFQRKTYLRVKKGWEKYILGKIVCKPGLFGVMVAMRLESNGIHSKSNTQSIYQKKQPIS